MKKFYQLVLPIAGLAVWLGVMVITASEGYHIQYLNAEWVEFTEHWVDLRQEALEDLDEYVQTGAPSSYEEFLTPYKKVLSYAHAIQQMNDPAVASSQAVKQLMDRVGYPRETAEDLVWHARNTRSVLGVDQDYKLFDEMIVQWKQVKSIADSAHYVLEAQTLPEKDLERIKQKLSKFILQSKQLDGRIQDVVESASLQIKYWSNTITQLLALFLFMMGGTIIGVYFSRIRNSQRKLKTLFENSPEGIAMTDQNGEVKRLNRSFVQMFGYAESEAKGKNIDEIVTHTEVDQRDALEITHRLKQKEIFREELVRYDKEGNPVPVLLSALPVINDGEVEAVFGVYIDISEQKKLEDKNRALLKREQTLRAKAEASQKQFEEMFEKAPSAIALVEGPDYKYTYTNKMHRDITGKDAVGSTIRSQFPEFERQGHLEVLDRVYETGEPYEGKEEPIQIERNGETLTIYRDYAYIPLKNEQDQTYAIFIDSVNVTDKVEYRQQLKRELKEKTTLLEEIHHRVKNNLASITGMLQLQLEHVDEPMAREALIDSELRIHTLADIHEILYESDKLSEIDMDQYIRKLVEHIQTVAGSPEQCETRLDLESFTLNIQQAQPLAILLNEIIQNAWKHAFPENRKGTISISSQLKGQQVQLKIQDSGIGIKEEDKIEKGLGMELIDSLQEQLQASIVRYNQGGTVYEIEFLKQ